MRTKVIQSFREENVPDWIGRCLASVREWAAYHDFEYEFAGDELLERVPDWYRDKAGAKVPVVTDLARLLWTQECLNAGEAELVVWLDADTFILAPEPLVVAPTDTCAFGREYWLQEDKKGRNRVYRNVHNAYCAFRAGCPVLPFLIFTVERLMERIDAEFIAPQFAGPKLITSLHNLVGFEVDARFGAISPLLARLLIEKASETDFSASGAEMLAILGERDEPMMAANLSHSLATEIEHDDLLDVLAAYGGGL